MRLLHTGYDPVGKGTTQPSPTKSIQALTFCPSSKIVHAPHSPVSHPFEGVCPISDLRASAEYRAYMAGVMVKRQLRAFWEGGEP